jgi:hypothetical protein
MIDSDESFRDTRPIIGDEIEEIKSLSEDLSIKKQALDHVSVFPPMSPLLASAEDIFVDDISVLQFPPMSPLASAKEKLETIDLFAELSGTIDVINTKELIHNPQRKSTAFVKKESVHKRRHSINSENDIDHEDNERLDENGNEIRVKKGMRVGYYQMTNKAVVRYCFIPKALLRSSSFNFDDVFSALNLKTPDLVFELNVAGDTSGWNLRLPEDKKNLRCKDSPEEGENGKLVKPDRYLQHYQGVVRENCKRLLRATSHACHQAGAVFKTRCTWNMEQDCVSRWIDDICICIRVCIYTYVYIYLHINEYPYI